MSQARLQLVFPGLADKIRRMAAMLEQEGIVIRVVQGLRTWAEQDALYAQGRKTPGKVVTNCPGGLSYHNFGLAVDCVPSTHADGPYDPDWNSSHPAWARMVAVAESLGLECGADWRTFKDYPHFQLTGKWPIGSPPQQVREIFKDSGIQGVWNSTGLIDPVPCVLGGVD